MEPWKRRDRLTDLPAGAHGFNGATAMEPWKSATSWHRRRTVRRFNGATAMEPWKRLSDPRRRSSIVLSFNGATAMEPWKSARGHGVLRCAAIRLQWGHGDGAVEERALRES